MGFLHCVIYLAAVGVVFFPIGRVLPKNLIRYDGFFFRERPWEKGLYKVLGLRFWQDKVPDMSMIFKKWMPPKRLAGKPTNEQLLIMVKETCVAEIIHVFISLFALVCLRLWPGFSGFLFTLLYILIGNVSFILVQRYNRPRLIRLMLAQRARSQREWTPHSGRTLILSANTGGGHNSCAAAIKEEYERNGRACDVTDGLRFFSPSVSSFISWGHVFMYRHLPRLYAAVYKKSEGSPFELDEHPALYTLFRRASEHLYAFILDNGYDTVISTHVFPALVLTVMRRESATAVPAVATGFVVTDHTLSPMVEAIGLDRVFIPDADRIDKYAKGSIQRGNIVVSGIPVRREFYEPADAEAARKKLDIPAEARHLLVMGGSMGCKKMMRVVDLVALRLKKDQYVTVVCGTNEKLAKKLRLRYVLNKRIRVLGFVSDIGTLMDSADVYLTKPGGLSTTEAAVKCLPMVLLDAVSACERYNMLYYTMHGASVTARHIDELDTLCREMLDTPALTERMREAERRLVRVNGAQVIRETMERLDGGEESVCFGS